MKIEKIRKALAARGFDAIVLTDRRNRLYATGFPSTAGTVYISQTQAVFYTDCRYIEAARAGAKGVVVSLVEKVELPLMLKIERYTQKDIERRSIKGLCAAFVESDTLQSVQKKGRASMGGKGGFEKKKKGEDKKVRVKIRERHKKNKGKPDFALKRARKAALKAAQEGKEV